MTTGVQVGLYTDPTASAKMLLDLTGRVRGLTLKTNNHGFMDARGFIPMNQAEAFWLFDRPGLPHLAVNWNGFVVWEGRLEDFKIVGEGAEFAAFGYYRGYTDTPYTATHRNVTALTIVNALIASVSALNAFMSSSTILVQDPGQTITEDYQDKIIADILERLCRLGDNQTPPRLWEAGVWEDRRLHFRPRGSAGRAWFVDVNSFEVERTLEMLYNSVYVVYQDASNQRGVTSTADDVNSQTRFGMKRRAALNVQTTDATLAGKARDAFLDYQKVPPPRAAIAFDRLYDASGAVWPNFAARSSDTITARNLPPTLSTSVDKIRTFTIAETNYLMETDDIQVTPEAMLPTVDMLLARP